jgi:hypothetical protein
MTALPANATELEKKMVAAFNKAAAAKPGFENPFIYMGDHFINKAAVIGDKKAKVVSDAARTAALEQDYADALYAAWEPYKQAANIYEQRPVLTNTDKAQYKKAAGYLVDIAAYKKAKSKAMSAELISWTYEETKWRGVAESIK